MWLRRTGCLAGQMFGIFAIGLMAAAPGIEAQQTSKSSRLPVTVIEKSRAVTSRQDRLNPAKGDRSPPGPKPAGSAAPEAEEPTKPAADDLDLLNLLIPSDPHVEAAPAPAKQRPVKTKRKKRRKRSSQSRPIDIAFKKGKLRINRFHTLKLDMAHNECREFPNVITTDYKLAPGALETLADNLVIVQKRLCAANGSIMVTCYQNRATISLRRARPDDGCSK